MEDLSPQRLRAPSYVISAKRFTMPIIRTNPNAVFAMLLLFLLIVRQSFSQPVPAFFAVSRASQMPYNFGGIVLSLTTGKI